MVIPMAIVVVAFLIVRLPFYLYYRLPHVAIDYPSYYQTYDRALGGHWPSFAFRTPGYPIFIALIIPWTKHVFALIVGQSIACLAAALLLVRSLVRAYPRFAIISAALVAVSVTSAILFEL